MGPPSDVFFFRLILFYEWKHFDLTGFGRREAPSAPYVRYLVKKVKEIGILIDKPKRENPVHKPENIAAVAESV